MLIKKILLSSLVLGCAGIISCTDLSGSSSLGQDIVNNVDPNRTNFENSFLFSDTAKSIAAISIASPNDTALGFEADTIIVGEKSDREARGSVLFSFDTTFKKTHIKDSLISINLKFVSLTLDTTIKVYPESLQIYDGNTNPLTSQASLESVKTVAESDSSYDSTSEEIIYKGLVNDVSLQSSIKDVFKSPGKTTSYFRFLITQNDTFFNLNPEATMTFEFKRNASIVKDSVTSKYSYFVIFEKSALKAQRDTVPVTSSETGRRAVFTFDMVQFWKSITKKAGFTEILSATLSISASMVPGGDTSTVIPFRYYMSPILFSDVNTLRDSMENSPKYGSVDKSDTVSVPVEYFLRRVTSSMPSKMYLYISNRHGNTIQQETTWIEPTITAVFTNTL
jgi:hypothetical protein